MNNGKRGVGAVKGEEVVAYIDRNKTYEVLTKYYHQRTPIQHQALREALNNVPVEDVVQRKYGKWIELAKCSYACSKCYIIYYMKNHFNFCPNCGAKMDKDGSAEQNETANIKDDDISWTDSRWYLKGERI